MYYLKLEGRKILITIGLSITCKLKSNRRKTTVELGVMFNSESESISTHTMRKELKGLRLNSCVALGKSLISGVNRGKKGFYMLGSIKIELCKKMEE